MGCISSKQNCKLPVTKHFIPRDTPEGQGQDVIETSNALGLSKTDLDALWVAFQNFDADGGGLIGLDEFVIVAQLGICESFARLVFRMFDRDGSGEINFEEFLVSTWGLCTCSTALLAMFSFSLFDLDGSESLTGSEVAFMSALLHNFSPSKNVALSLKHFEDQMIANSNTEISIQEFLDEVHKGEVLLMPATEMQLILMQKTLGISRWQKLQLDRQKNHGNKTLFSILGYNSQEEKNMKARGLGRVHPPESKKVDAKMEHKLEVAKALRKEELKRLAREKANEKYAGEHEERHKKDIKRETGDGIVNGHARDKGKAAAAPGAGAGAGAATAAGHGHGHGHAKISSFSSTHNQAHAAAPPYGNDDDEDQLGGEAKAKPTHAHSHSHSHSHSHPHSHGHGHGHGHGHVAANH